MIDESFDEQVNNHLRRLEDDRAANARVVEEPAVEEQPEAAAELPADVVASVLAEVLKIRELISLYLPAFNDVRPNAFSQLTRIEQLVRGEQQ